MRMNRTLVAGAVAVLFCVMTCANAQNVPPKPGPLRVAFTFDDLPAHGSLPPGEDRLSVARSILETLKREKMPPVFGFVNAKRVQEAPQTIEVLRLWRSYGEPLGSHTFSHIDLDAVTTEEFEADNEKNEATLRDLAAGQNWHMFRYPYLHEGDTLAKRQAVQQYLKANGYQVAEVTLDFGDYLWNEPYARCSAKKDDAAIAELEKTYLAAADQSITVFREASQTLYGRDIPYVLLMHIGAFDAKMLPRLIALLRQRGFAFTTIEEAEKDPAYAIDPAIGRKGGGSLEDLLAASRQVKLPPNPKPDKLLDAMCR